jgi:sorting nexin-1/2
LKSYQTWQTAEHHLVKLRISLEKTKLNSKTKPEKVSQIESEIIDAESKIISTKKEFEEISRVLKEEMALFERDKIDDINAAMQGYLDAVIKHQQSMVDVWEGYFKAIESDN